MSILFVSLTPDGLRLGLDATLGGEDGHGAVEDSKRTLDFCGEVHVAGSVDDVDSVFFPEAGGSSGRDGDTTFLFLNHPVHGGSTVMDLTDLMVDTGVVEDTLGRRRFTGVDMSHDTNVSGLFQRYLSRHIILP